MCKLFMAAALAAQPFIVLAQATATPASSAASEANTAQELSKGTRRVGILAFTIEQVQYVQGLTSDCSTSGSSDNLPANVMVIVARKAICKRRYASSSDQYYEILYGGRHLFVPKDSLTVEAADVKQLETLTPEDFAASIESWEGYSRRLHVSQLEDALKALEATRKHGIAISKMRIYDTSEHTDGTGFEVEFFNTTKKIIKYTTFNVIGLNAVGDPVRNRLGTGTTATLRGVGPVEPDESAGYDSKYMWHSDLVQSFRLQSVKVEFMDGTSRVISDVRAIQLKPTVRATLDAPAPPTD